MADEFLRRSMSMPAFDQFAGAAMDDDVETGPTAAFAFPPPVTAATTASSSTTAARRPLQTPPSTPGSRLAAAGSDWNVAVRPGMGARPDIESLAAATTAAAAAAAATAARTNSKGSFGSFGNLSRGGRARAGSTGGANASTASLAALLRDPSALSVSGGLVSLSQEGLNALASHASLASLASRASFGSLASFGSQPGGSLGALERLAGTSADAAGAAALHGRGSLSEISVIASNLHHEADALAVPAAQQHGVLSKVQPTTTVADADSSSGSSHGAASPPRFAVNFKVGDSDADMDDVFGAMDEAVDVPQSVAAELYGDVDFIMSADDMDIGPALGDLALVPQHHVHARSSSAASSYSLAADSAASTGSSRSSPARLPHLHAAAEEVMAMDPLAAVLAIGLDTTTTQPATPQQQLQSKRQQQQQQQRQQGRMVWGRPAATGGVASPTFAESVDAAAEATMAAAGGSASAGPPPAKRTHFISSPAGAAPLPPTVPRFEAPLHTKKQRAEFLRLQQERKQELQRDIRRLEGVMDETLGKMAQVWQLFAAGGLGAAVSSARLAALRAAAAGAADAESDVAFGLQ